MDIKEEFDKFGVRPEVLRFAMHMEAILRRHDHKGGWIDCSYEYLFDKLREEVKELKQAFAASGAYGNTQNECGDVGNIVMMIFDKAWYERANAWHATEWTKEMEAAVRLVEE